MIKSLGVFKDYNDNSMKSVYGIEGKIIEMTLLDNKPDMDVVCVPTHHFCNLGCKMCHLTNNKLNKKMIPIEVDDFINCLFRTLTEDGKKITDKKKLLISFMGVGEPLLNLRLIEGVYKREKDIRSLGYDTVGYALATMMPNDNILKLMELVDHYNIPLKVHFSMHTPIDTDRYSLIPSTNVSVIRALEYLDLYRKRIMHNDIIMEEYRKLHRTSDPTEIHYTLIKGVNDSDKELELLYYLLQTYNITIKFIRFNPINELERSSNEDKWVGRLKNIPTLRVKTYSPPGKEIGSSCGEFTKHYYHEEIETEEDKKEFEEWKVKHLIRY